MDAEGASGHAVLHGVPVRVPKDLGWDAAVLDHFQERMPELFRAGHDPDDAYQRLLYGVAHEFRPEHLDAVDRFLDLPPPAWPDAATKRTAVQVLDAAHYPDAACLDALPTVDGLTLPHVSGYLHFFHHVYVPYDEESVAGLTRLGVRIPWTEDLDAATYAAYTEAVEELKERLPYWDFPERNLSLQRVVQAALHAYGSG